MQDALRAPTPASRGYILYVIAVLMLATLASQLDRQLPALLVSPIKAAFQISDSAFSLIQGYAFALAYTLIGLPFGRIVDGANRRNLILGGIIAWSVTTMLAGCAQGYWQLFAARIGVGIGEACLAPAAYSMIADYVGPASRGRALAAFYVSLSVGSGASLLLGGLIYRALPAAGLVLPGLGLVVPWRLMFILAGAPGIVLALVFLSVREPPRRESGRPVSDAIAPIGEFVALLRRHGATFSRVFLSAGANAPIAYGGLAWAPAFFERRFGIPASTAGLKIGGVVALCGFLGTVAAGSLSDRWVKARIPAARLRINLASWVAILPGVILWPLASSPTQAFIFLGLTIAGLAFGQSAIPPAIQDVVPNRMRGQAIAVYLLIGGLMGIGLGPTAVALVTDYGFHDGAALPYAIVCVSVPLCLLGIWASWSGLKPYARTYEALTL